MAPAQRAPANATAYMGYPSSNPQAPHWGGMAQQHAYPPGTQAPRFLIHTQAPQIGRVPFPGSQSRDLHIICPKCSSTHTFRLPSNASTSQRIELLTGGQHATAANAFLGPTADESPRRQRTKGKEADEEGRGLARQPKSASAAGTSPVRRLSTAGYGSSSSPPACPCVERKLRSRATLLLPSTTAAAIASDGPGSSVWHGHAIAVRDVPSGRLPIRTLYR